MDIVYNEMSVGNLSRVLADCANRYQFERELERNPEVQSFDSESVSELGKIILARIENTPALVNKTWGEEFYEQSEAMDIADQVLEEIACK